MARPTDYSIEVTALICERLGLGESLRKICEDAEMPGKSTVMRWLHDHAEFRDQYARAREAQAEYWAEEIIQISDDDQHDAVIDPETGATKQNSEFIARSRLRVDTRKWLMARMAPKKYGDKIDIDQHTTHELGASVSDLMKAIDGRTRSK
jgi:hypothetical protein